MDQATLRAWWWFRQGLDGSLAGKAPAEVLEKTGWARSVGGSGPYLGLFSRAGLSREEMDRALADKQIHELPAARGCTYIVPASDFALALRVGQPFGDQDMRTARKLGVTDAEIDKLSQAVVDAVSKGPKDPDEIRSAVGPKARNLGPEGAKKGVTTTLPLALGKLQAIGEIRRIPTNGRIDQQRYKYVAWKPNPLAKCKLSIEEANVELARRFFAWTGPATLAEFQWFSALGVKASKEALEPLRLVPLEPGSDRLMMAEDLDALKSFKAPKKAQYALIASIDGLLLLRRDVKGLVDDSDIKRRVMEDKALKDVGNLKDLPSHGIFDRGRLIGLWEYDQPGESIAWSSWVTPDKALKEAVARMETFVREQLGDARSFSLDSPKSRAPRVEALRKAAAG